MVNKAITYIKQYFFMLALVATFVGFSAFKLADDPEPGWYVIDIDETDPDEQTKQEIVSFYDENPPTAQECNLANTEEPCQVELELTNFSSTIPLEGMTVQQAIDSGAVAANYSRRPEL